MAHELLAEMYIALSEPIGRGIPCDPKDADRLRQQLYRVRREANDATLAALSFRMAPDGKAVWITKEKTNGAATSDEVE